MQAEYYFDAKGGNMTDFFEVRNYLDELVKRGVPGCSTAIYLNGESVFSYCAGYADHDKTRLTSESDIYYIYSCTKPVTVTAVMQLIEQNKLKFEDPVCRYLPEFAEAYYLSEDLPVKVGTSMTIWHLLTMSAGLDYDINGSHIRAARERYGDDATTRQIVSSFVEKPLTFKPGQQFLYSLCHDVLAAIVEVVSGKSYGEYLRENIFDPLGMNDTGFFPTEAQFSRMSDQYCMDGNQKITLMEKSQNVHRLAPKYESGGAGLFSTLTDYGSFAAAMSCGGQSIDGTRILKPETIDLIRTSQVSGFEKKNSFPYHMQGYEYGLGVRTLVDRGNGQPSSIGEFGWDGAAGAFILMDPAVRVAIVYMQHVNDWPCLFGSMHEPLRDLSYKALGL